MKRSRAQSAEQTSLTLEEVALLVDGFGETVGTDAAKRLGLVVKTDPRFAHQIAELEELAQEAGLEPRGSGEYLSAAWSLHQALSQLLESDAWKHPSEVLDPDGSLGISYEGLVRLARAREQDDPDRLLTVRQRLEEAYAAEMAETALLDHFVHHLLVLPPEQAELLLGRARHEYRSKVTRRELSAR